MWNERQELKIKANFWEAQALSSTFSLTGVVTSNQAKDANDFAKTFFDDVGKTENPLDLILPILSKKNFVN